MNSILTSFAAARRQRAGQDPSRGSFGRIARQLLIPIALATSLHAQTWELPSAGQPPAAVGGLAFAKGRFVLVSDTWISYSDDGLAWLPANSAAAGLTGARVAGNRFFAAKGAAIYASNNGAQWAVIGTMPTSSSVLNEYHWATDGQAGLAARTRTVSGEGITYGQIDVFRSADLANWESGAALPGTGERISGAVQSVAFGSDRYVINYLVGDFSAGVGPTMSITAVSRDGGVTWTRSQFVAGDNTALRIVYGNGFFLAVSANGAVYRSEDGLNFRPTNADLPPGFTPQLWFSGGKFLRHRNAPGAATYGSVDGSRWYSLGTWPLPTTNWVGGIAYGHGRFVASGQAPHAIAGPRPFFATSVQAGPPVVRVQPTAQQLAEGRRLHLAVVLDGQSFGVSYRWMKNGVVLADTNSPVFALPSVTRADAGSYRCLITNAHGTVGSDVVEVTIVDPVAGGRLTNLSANLLAGSGGQPVHIGFVLSGSNAKPVTLRAVGPTLAQFSVPNPLADPTLTLQQGATVYARNDNWSTDDGSRVGGFPLPAGSLDAAISTTVAPSAYAVVVGGSEHAAGRVLTEVYDGNTADGINRLSNLSVRAHVAAGGSLVAGFVVQGHTSLRVVIRGVGPTLAEYGVPSPLPNPRLRLFRGQEVIATNDQWLDDDGRSIGAFPLPVGSPDAVLVMTLPPGVYTAELTSAIPPPIAGVALLEIYDAQ